MIGKWILMFDLINIATWLMNVIYTELSPLEVFYKDSTVLITGGNGFLGKVLIEKLLRCFEIEKIFLLIRVKNNENIHKRMENLLNEPVHEANEVLFKNERPSLSLSLFCTDFRLSTR
jgi:Male sterility protein